MTIQISGMLSAVGHSAAFVPSPQMRKTGFNVSVYGSFAATAQLQRSFDSGTTWLPLTKAGASAFTWTAPASELVTEPEVGVEYRVAVIAWTSGTISYRLSR